MRSVTINAGAFVGLFAGLWLVAQGVVLLSGSAP